MRKHLFKLFSILIAVVLFFTALPISSSALTESEIQNNIKDLEQQSAALEKEINRLQGQINEQAALKKAVEKKIAIVQQQINLCNTQISNINASIAKNKAEIEKTNEQIRQDKFAFQKRLRAIYMSNTGSSLQMILGAEDFSEFLQLSEFTATMSARDKKLMEGLVESIKKLEKKQEENNVLLQEQIEVKKVVAAKQQELLTESNKIQGIINSIDKDQSALESTNKNIETQIKNYRDTLASLTNPGNSGGIYTGGAFLWPTTFYRISAGFKSNDSVHNGKHDGIDIIGSYRGQIQGAPVYAIADGTVDICKGGCPHNYPKSSGCGCNGNFGNYVRVNHGSTYLSIYGHLQTINTSLGARVKKGQLIGTVGSTGWSTGFHLHFGIAVNGKYVDPMDYYS